MPLLDLDAIRERLCAQRHAFAAAEPFPHLVVDGLLPREVACGLAAEFDRPDLPWQSLHHVNERKRVCSDRRRMGPIAAGVVEALHSDAFLTALHETTGLPRLVGDPELDGAGLHQTERGGHLNVHVDALAHTKRRRWSRQLNLILFLNPDWAPAHGGSLELWDARARRCVRRIEPLLNRCVLFRTSEISFHGVPERVACPDGAPRRSLALYYFRDEGRVVPLRPTRYVPRPGDPPMRRALIRMDRALVAGYSLLKRYTPVDDVRASRVLRLF
jgi:hypothetical protein